METLKSIILLLLFFAVNIVISVFNKWEFNGPLQCPIYVTMTHQLICFLCCLALSPWQNYQPIEGCHNRMKVLMLPLFFILNIALNNLSLLYTTLALNQLIRAFCPVVVAFFAYLIEDKKPSLLSGFTILFLVFGVTLSVTTNPDLEFLGTLICFASVVGNALQTVTVSVLKVMKLDPLSIIYHTSLYNMALMLPLYFILGEHDKLMGHIEESGIGFILQLTLAGGLIAFCYNLILISFIQNTSSVYSSVAGGFKTVLILWISFVFFHQRLNMLSFVGILVACFAFVANSIIMLHEKKQAAKISVAKSVKEFPDDEDEESCIQKPGNIEAA